jgi:hypothetical protein
MERQTRSACYKIMDRLEDIDAWYAALPPSTKLEWRHPKTIAKHAPKHLVAAGKGHNKPPPRRVKRPPAKDEVERLRALLILVIKRLAQHEPDALELLDHINPHEWHPKARVQEPGASLGTRS